MWLTLRRTSLGFWVQLSFWVKWVCCCVFFQDNLGSTFLCGLFHFTLLYFISFQEQFGFNFLCCVILCISRAIFQYTNTYPENFYLKPNRPSWKWISSFGDNDYSPVLFIRWGASQVQFLTFLQWATFFGPSLKTIGNYEGSPTKKVLFWSTECLTLGILMLGLHYTSFCVDLDLHNHVTHWNSSMILDRCWAQVQECLALTDEIMCLTWVISIKFEQ